MACHVLNPIIVVRCRSV